jgi:hypothetical protein
MVGFTSISEKLGEEGTFALIRPIYELMAAAVKEQGGSVKDFTGTGSWPCSACPMRLRTRHSVPAGRPWSSISASLPPRPRLRGSTACGPVSAMSTWNMPQHKYEEVSRAVIDIRLVLTSGRTPPNGADISDDGCFLAKPHRDREFLVPATELIGTP